MVSFKWIFVVAAMFAGMVGVGVYYFRTVLPANQAPSYWDVPITFFGAVAIFVVGILVKWMIEDGKRGGSKC